MVSTAPITICSNRKSTPSPNCTLVAFLTKCYGYERCVLPAKTMSNLMTTLHVKQLRNEKWCRHSWISTALLFLLLRGINPSLPKITVLPPKLKSQRLPNILVPQKKDADDHHPLWTMLPSYCNGHFGSIVIYSSTDSLFFSQICLLRIVWDSIFWPWPFHKNISIVDDPIRSNISTVEITLFCVGLIIILM